MGVQIATPFLVSATLIVWINRSLEALWLLTVVFVPLAFLGRNYGEWSSVIGSYELPKIAILRTLVGFMAILWFLEWSLQASNPAATRANGGSLGRRIAACPRQLSRWLHDQPTRWLNLVVAIYAVSTLLSTVLSASINVSLWGDVPGQDSYSAYTVIAYILLFAVVSTHLKSVSQLWRLFWAITVMAVLVAGYSVAQHNGHDFLSLIEPRDGTRATSTVGNPLFLGSLLLMTIPVSLLLATVVLESRRNTLGIHFSDFSWKVGLWSVILAAQLLGIVFTFSRGPWVSVIFALAVVMTLVAVFANRRILFQTALVLALAAVMTSIIAYLPYGGGKDDASSRTSGNASATRALTLVSSISGQVGGGGLSGRVDIWDTSWGLMIDRPWFGFDSLSISWLRPVIGYGPDLFRTTALLESLPPTESGSGVPLLPQEVAHAHNYFIHQGVELGFLGLMTSLGIFVAVFLVGGYRLFRFGRNLIGIHALVLIGVLGSLSGRFLEQFVGVARVSDLTIFWVLLAIFVALPVVLKNGQVPPGVALPGEGVPIHSLKSSWKISWQMILRMMLVASVTIGIGVLTWEKTVNYVRAAVFVDQAAEQFRTGQPRDALFSLDRAISLAPDVSSYYLRRIEVGRAFEDREDALGAYNCNSPEHTPNYLVCQAEENRAFNEQWERQRPFSVRAKLALAASLNELAFLKQDTGLLRQSVVFYLEAASMVPHSWPVWDRLAEIHISLGQPDRALAALESSLAITSDTKYAVFALFLQRKAYLGLDRPQEAIEALDEAVRVHPDNWEPYYVRGKARYERGQLRQAIDDFDQSLQFAPNDVKLFYSRGTVYYELGRHQRAVEEFNEALFREPEYVEAYNNRGLAFAKLGQLERAIQDFSAAIRIEPQTPLYYNNRGFVLRDQGKLSESINDLTQAINLDPEFAMAYYNRALAYTLLGRGPEAAQDAESALGLGFDRILLSAGIENIQQPR